MNRRTFLQSAALLAASAPSALPQTAGQRVVLPNGDGVKAPDRVAVMGNFHPTSVSPDESWVTVGEWQPKNGIKGDLLLARIRWIKPNRLVA